MPHGAQLEAVKNEVGRTFSLPRFAYLVISASGCQASEGYLTIGDLEFRASAASVGR